VETGLATTAADAVLKPIPAGAGPVGESESRRPQNRGVSLGRCLRERIGYNAWNEGTLHATNPLPPTAMPLGIRPINDFAFKRAFGAAENRAALISLVQFN
jgi:hypothetical protein